MPFCRNCGTEYSEGARFCGNCGTALEAPAQPATYYITPGVGEITLSTLPRKDAVVAISIAAFGGLFLFGLGHFYLGKIGRGTAFLLVGFVAKIALAYVFLGILSGVFTGEGAAFAELILIALVNFGLWVWQIYDPYTLAKTYNAEVQRTGKAPW